MRILLANIGLRGRTGTEIVTMDMARGLTRRGHQVLVFTPDLGESGRRLRQEGIAVTDRLSDSKFRPDLVHGNHSIDLVQGLIAYPGVAGVFVCHNPHHWICSPPDLSRIQSFVSVDRLGLERIERELPRAAGKVQIIHNAVDLEIFTPRDPLPSRAKRALILTKNNGHIETIQTACSRLGLKIDAIGPGLDLVVDDLPARLRQYDIVFATARMAIEAMATGCAVIVCDSRGLAGMATKHTVDVWRDYNFGYGVLSRTVSIDSIVSEIERYDATDAAAVADDVRKTQDLDSTLEKYESLYERALRTHICVDPEIEGRELSELMRLWLPVIEGFPPIAFSFLSKVPELTVAVEGLKAVNREQEEVIRTMNKILNSRSALVMQTLRVVARRMLRGSPRRS
jgi:hypothetical protein